MLAFKFHNVPEIIPFEPAWIIPGREMRMLFLE